MRTFEQVGHFIQVAIVAATGGWFVGYAMRGRDDAKEER